MGRVTGFMLFRTARILRAHEAREFRFAAVGVESGQRAVRKSMRRPLLLLAIFAFAFATPVLAQRPQPAPAANLIDLNSASRDDLMTLDGVGEVRADAIIRARPFRAKTELVERRLIPESLYEKIADKVVARPLPGTPPTPTAKPVPQQPKRS